VAIARYYKVGVFDSATPTAQGGTVATTTATPILWGTTTATNDCNISAIRVSCLGAASFPSNASFAASVQLTTGTKAGGLAATPVQMGQGALAANTVFSTAGGSTASSPITGLTPGKFYWSQDIPFTAGANWGEWFTPGFEVNIPASTGFAVYITESSAGTATTFAAELEFTE
jgi:hypothetical protein